MAAEKKLDEERRIEEAAKPKQLPWREKLVALRRARGQEQLEKAKAHARGEYPFDDEDGSAAEEKEAAEARARARRPNTGVSSLADTVSVEEENRGAAEVAARVLAGGSAQRSPLTPSSKANKRSHWGADAEDESDSRASTAKAAHGADGGRLTVPQSPNFTKMSWQRQHPRPRAPTQVASSRVPAQVSSRAPAQASSSAGKGQKARPRRRRSKSTGAKKRGSGGSQTSLGAAGTTGLGLTGTAKGAALQERSHGLTRMRARLHAGYY
uniref:Uncharacterized protein n=1 Tax=Phaeomonas parva TaxID=124430 RepID=A0A7S1U3U7_9STRA